MTDPLLRLDPKTTALLLVDLQEKLVPAVVEPGHLLRQTRLLLRAASALGVPVVATTQYERGLGPIVEPIRALLPAAAVRLEKTAFSCFDDGRFAGVLAAVGPERTLVVAGIEAHICVAGTVLGALRRGIPVEIVSDAVSSRSVRDAEVALERLGRAGALLATAESVVYELIGDSSSTAFRAMLPYLKGEP